MKISWKDLAPKVGLLPDTARKRLIYIKTANQKFTGTAVSPIKRDASEPPSTSSPPLKKSKMGANNTRAGGRVTKKRRTYRKAFKKETSSELSSFDETLLDDGHDEMSDSSN